MSKSSEHHERMASGEGAVPVAIVTVSDSRTAETDSNGQYLRERIGAAGHELAAYHLLRDEPEEVAALLRELATEGRARVAVVNGGTGISRRDATFDAIHPLLDREIPGFGEIFRMLSFEQVGAAAMLSRATAGIHQGLVIFSTPGSPAAVRLAWERLIEPQLRHLAWELER
jgi:molybdopterin adenylyltransferase